MKHPSKMGFKNLKYLSSKSRFQNKKCPKILNAFPSKWDSKSDLLPLRIGFQNQKCTPIEVTSI